MPFCVFGISYTLANIWYATVAFCLCRYSFNKAYELSALPEKRPVSCFSWNKRCGKELSNAISTYSTALQPVNENKYFFWYKASSKFHSLTLWNIQKRIIHLRWNVFFFFICQKGLSSMNPAKSLRLKSGGERWRECGYDLALSPVCQTVNCCLLRAGISLYSVQ